MMFVYLMASRGIGSLGRYPEGNFLDKYLGRYLHNCTIVEVALCPPDM